MQPSGPTFTSTPTFGAPLLPRKRRRPTASTPRSADLSRDLDEGDDVSEDELVAGPSRRVDESYDDEEDDDDEGDGEQDGEGAEGRSETGDATVREGRVEEVKGDEGMQRRVDRRRKET